MKYQESLLVVTILDVTTKDLEKKFSAEINVAPRIVSQKEDALELKAASHVDDLLQRLMHHKAPRSFENMYASLVLMGLSSHTAAFGLTLVLVPKYARELNPIASATGLGPYFPVTILVSLSVYYLIWRSHGLTKKHKILLASTIAVMATLDLLIDLSAFMGVAGAGAFS